MKRISNDEVKIELRFVHQRSSVFRKILNTYQDPPMNVCSILLIKKFIEHLLPKTRHF